MFNTFKKEFKACEIRFDQKTLVAVSGGVDSMVLWHLMHESKHSYGIAHVNFSLRGKESDADEALIEQVAQEREIPFYSKKVDTEKYAAENGLSIQMAARELRYDFFKELAQEFRYDCLSTAHHLEDDFETLLLNLNRGTGVKGLAGIRSTAKRFRPLLSFTKAEIREYADQNDVEFREDKSNESTTYDRNWFRHEIIDTWKQRNPAILNTMRQNLSHLKQTYDILEEFIQKESNQLQTELKEGYIEFATIDELDRKNFYLFHVLSPLGFTVVQIDSMLTCIKKKQVGKAFYGKEWSIYVDRDRLDVVKGGETQETEIIYVIDKNTSLITEPIQLEFKRLLVDEYKGELNRQFEVIDRDQLVFPLQLRKWKAGDKMRPLGMQGKKNVSDVLTDLKIARAQKENTFVLLSEGKVVWLVGYRLDDRFKVTDTSKKLLQIKL